MAIEDHQAAEELQAYWEERLGRDYDLAGVGYAGLGREFNERMYRVRRHGFLRLLRPLVPAGGAVDVLDVGSGTGFYVQRWEELGVAALTGSDITQTAVEGLRERHPAHRFVRMDIGADELPLAAASFDFVSAIDVLFHILKEDAHARAIANIGRLLRPGGRAILSENLYPQTPAPGPHQVGRSEATIVERIAAAGLVLERRAPMFVLMNSPIRSDSRLHRAAWSRLVATVSRRPALGGAIGQALLPLELALVDRRRSAPSTEFLVCRRA